MLRHNASAGENPASAEGLPEINRRRLLGGIVAASAASAVAGGSVALAATQEPELVKTPREQAIWHMREIERLVGEDGGAKVCIIITSDYGDDSGYEGYRSVAIIDGRLQNRDNMFAPKGVQS